MNVMSPAHNCCHTSNSTQLTLLNRGIVTTYDFQLSQDIHHSNHTCNVMISTKYNSSYAGSISAQI